MLLAVVAYIIGCVCTNASPPLAGVWVHAAAMAFELAAGFEDYLYPQSAYAKQYDGGCKYKNYGYRLQKKTVFI